MHASTQSYAHASGRLAHWPLRGAACVIEPDETDRDGIAELLLHMGFEPHCAATGIDGALIADDVRPSVIIINTALEDVRALKLIRRLRRRAPSALILALTPDPYGSIAADTAGADAVLASPPCGEALCSTINQAEPRTPKLKRRRDRALCGAFAPAVS